MNRIAKILTLALSLVGIGCGADDSIIGQPTDPQCEVSTRAEATCEWPSNPVTGPLFRADPGAYGMICADGARPDPERGHIFQLNTDLFCVLPAGLPGDVQ